MLQSVVGVAGRNGCCRVWWVLQELSTEIKKNFFLFLPSHPHKCGSSALFIGVSRVRVGVRVELLPSHLPSHYPHTSGTGSILSGFLFTEFNKSTRKVQLSGTDSSA